MSKYLSKKYESLLPYTPGEQPKERSYIKLNTNESPYPPAPAVKAALSEEAEKLMLYSDPCSTPLVKAISEFYSVAPERVFVGNGSDEVLAFAFHAFCGGDKGVVFPDITYGFYPVFADFFGIKYRTVKLESDFNVNVSDYDGVKDTVVIANPNAQTGVYLPLEQVEALVAADPDRIVIVDEAYIDFGGESAVALCDRYDNLLVVQTFSKSRNLAGARVGFAIGNEALIADLNTMKYSFNPYNINRMSMAAAEAAINDRAYFTDCTNKVKVTRERVKAELKELGFAYPDSMANFILAQSDKIDGAELYKRLKASGILVRHFDDERIKNYIRITIGTDSQMDAMLDSIRKILEEL